MTHTAISPRTPARPSTLGALLKDWRAHRGMSQLALALEAHVSQRHVSFLESGRAAPSRDMIVRLAHALDLPLRARNELLTAAGFAPAYSERSLNQSEMQPMREILTRILEHHEPYPAMVLDGSWNIVFRNEANRRIMTACLDGFDPLKSAGAQPVNFVRLMFAHDGLRRRVRNWPQVATQLLARVRREARAYPGSPSERLYDELVATAGEWQGKEVTAVPLAPTIPLELEVRPNKLLRLTNTLTTFGTPQDVSLQELRIEMAYPLDECSRELLAEWARADETS
jgi:transcriptional regulator with XRE-family HTH domain